MAGIRKLSIENESTGQVYTYTPRFPGDLGSLRVPIPTRYKNDQERSTASRDLISQIRGACGRVACQAGTNFIDSSYGHSAFAFCDEVENCALDHPARI